MEKMSERLFKQTAKNLLHKVLLTFGEKYLNEDYPEIKNGNLTYNKKSHNYHNQCEEGKLLNEIYDFLNKRAILLTPNPKTK